MNGQTQQRNALTLELESALRDAHIPVLMAALVHITGNASHLSNDLRPKYGRVRDDQGGLSDADQQRIRQMALEVLSKHFAGAPLPPQPDMSVIRQTMEFVASSDIPEKYVALLAEQMELDAGDATLANSSAPHLGQSGSKMRGLIVGAGMSGLLMAIKLKQAGVEFQVIEKNAGVGGTWFLNDYPGCRVDTPNHLYSFSFEPSHGWPSYFSDQKVLRRYFQDIVQKWSLESRIRLNTELVRADFSVDKAQWLARVRGPGGSEEVIEADFLVSAVGQLNEPLYPDIASREKFLGPTFHSARWRHDVDLADKRVAVIGTGASALQLVPEVAKRARQLTVFQRSPPWLVSTPEYHDQVPAGAKWLLEHVPYYAKWYRLRLFWKMSHEIFEAITVDPEWRGPPNAVSALSARLSKLLAHEMTQQLDETNRALASKLVPDYPFGAKRALRDNGQWIRTLTQPHVRLVTDPIAEMTAQGIKTSTGTEHELDVIIYATGFRASEFLPDIDLVGRNGITLHEHWAEDAKAYLGILVPQFPNLFILYGPNTNIVVDGSIIFMSECSANYIMGCLRLLEGANARTIEVRGDVHDRYNDLIDSENRSRAWGIPQVTSWYKNRKGRVSQNWPHRLIDYWIATRKVEPGDLVVSQ